MATNQDLTKFVVWAPDSTDEGALARRLAVRPGHLENLRGLASEGIIRVIKPTGVGGAFLSSDSASAAPGDRKIIGSCIIIEAESLEAARKLVEDDVYYKTNVWDKEKLQILPIMLATPLPGPPAGVSAL